ncbi:MAG: hypothetical protein KBT11_08440 [Treponema sp.]|nr:hypothetical protein [Candidatus Treponema equifaecale]
MRKITGIFFVFIIFTKLFSQEALKSIEEEYYDFLSLQGLAERPTLNYRTLSDSEWKLSADDHIWKDNNLGTKRTIYESDKEATNWFTKGIEKSLKLKVYGPEWFNSYNTAAPYGQNDGGLWQGKGYNTSLTGGVRVEGFGFEGTIKPQVSWSQNKSFDLMPSAYDSEYGYFGVGNIDLVQRYGNESFWNFDFGDSEIRYTWKNFTLGFGTQSPWIGPAWLNPMLGSNNTSTYPKVDLGVRKTNLTFKGINFGDIEGRIWTGKLTESDYFDNDNSNNERMLNGISLAYAPSFIPNLKIGVNRIFITYWRTENLKYIGRLFTLSHSNALSSSGNDEDQKVALNIDWTFPSVGFEVYGELGIDDFTSDEKANPFHTAIYTIGAKQIIPLNLNKISNKLPSLKSELIFEWNNFEMSQDFQLQWNYIGYYGHGFVRQGYTQKGQIIGAGSGYFGNSQYIGYNIYFPKGKVNLFFHRDCPDTNFIYNKANGDMAQGKQSDWYALYETNWSKGIFVDYFLTKSFFVHLGFVDTKIINPNYRIFNHKFDRNEQINLILKYNF